MVSTFSSPRFAALLLLSGASALLVWTGQAPAHPAAAAPIPTTLAGWDGKPVAVDARTVQILETDDITLMEYHAGTQPPVWLAQVAGFGNRAAFHPPELCYVGSHFEVLARGPVSVMVNGQPRQFMRLIVGQGRERFEAWYWFTAGQRVTPNYYQQQLWLVLDTLRRRQSSGTLVRVSTPVDDPARSRERLLSFISALMRASDIPHGS